MRFGSICSGIEAASTAWHPLGWETAYVAEIEPFPCAVLAERVGAGRPINMPDEPAAEAKARQRALRGVTWGALVTNYGDFTRIADDAPSVDLLVGGTPCQAFSVAGARQSLADARGNLTLEFVRLIHATESLRWAVWENVPGVLSTDDNAYGCFLGALVGSDDALRVPGDGRWPDAGMVAGPLGRAAWRILDAQHFGVAQRRRRVFLVFCPRGSSGDPVAVLFERKGMPWDPEARGEAGEGPAGTIAGGADRGVCGALAPALTSSGRGVAKTGETRGQDPVVAVAFGGNNTAGPIDVATACNAHGGPHGRCDFESETFIAQATPIPFDTTQITSPSNRSRVAIGDPCHPLASSAHPPAIAFQARQQMCAYGEQTGALDTCSPQGQAVAVAHAFDTRQADVIQYGDMTGPLDTGWPPPGVQATPTSAVRRLTPRECERLQGFPDDHTAINWHGKPATDGPRYKALGNSKAVPVVSWIGQRIQAFEDGLLDDWQFDWSLVPWIGAAAGIGVAKNFQASQSGLRMNDTVGTLDANYGSRRHNGVIQQ